MFYKGALEEYSYKGKVYALPVIYNAWVMWYDKRLFREHGWEVPETWEALLELGDKAREQGLVPVSFQGKFGVYSACYFYHLIQSIGGLELYDRCQAMDPGAFTHPDTVEAARKLQELSERCFAPASLAWSHEEAQDELCQGRAAMVACGLWFEKEMEGKIPPEMELSAFPLPPVAGGKGDPRAIYAGPGETIYKFRDGKNVELADPFLAELISVENMVAFANQNSSLVAIREANELADLTPAMETVRAFLAEKTIRYQEKLETYAQPWEMQYRRPLTEALLAGEITPEAFCQKLEAGMEIMRNDPDLVKPEFKSHTKH
jgi:N-acetylglucosamine transport system substrate-binding protein